MVMPARKSKRKILSLSDQLVEAIKERIVNNEYPPGTILQIDALAEENDVSTTPVREALLRLDNQGFVFFARNKGATVTEINDTVISEVYEFRSLLEGNAIAHVCLLSPPELEEIERDLLTLSANPNLFELYQKTDNSLHDLLAESEPNSLMREPLSNLKNQAKRIRHFVENTPFHDAVVREINEEHLQVVRAIKSGDVPLARKAITTHLENAKQRAITALDSQSRGSNADPS